jgi:hypothetical protein
MQKKLFMMALLISSSAYATDYSKCSSSLNPDPYEYYKDGSTEPMPYHGMFPFKLTDDGQVKPIDGIVSYEKNEEGNKEVIEYNIASMIKPQTIEDIKKGDIGAWPTFNPQKRKVKTIITRNEQGDIVQIKTDHNFTQEELNIMFNNQQNNFRAFADPKMVENLDKEAKKNGKERYEIPFSYNKNETLNFEVKNGKCVLISQQQETAFGNKLDSPSVTNSQFNVNLCKDIDNFINKHPEATACFKADLNKKMSSIFDKYVDKSKYGLGGAGAGNVGPMVPGVGIGYPGTGGGGYGVPGGVPMGAHGRPNFNSGGFGGFGMMGYGFDLEMRILGQGGGLPWLEGDNKGKESVYRRMQSSPTILGANLLQNCYDRGLGTYIDDPSLWKDIVQPKQGGTTGEGGSVGN